MSNTTCTPDDCHSKGPRGGTCKECQKARALRRYHENREARNEYNRRWRADNPERVKANFARWYSENKDRQHEYYMAHQEERLEQGRARRAANPGAGTADSRRWRKSNPERWALRNRENSRRRQTGQTSSRVAYEAILERDGMVCHLCTQPILDLSDLHMDHVIPLARGGEHHESNIKPAHALCNMRKGSRIA